MSEAVGIHAEVEHGPVCRCAYCQEITKLAPRLKSPGWVWWIGLPPDVQTVTIKELRATRKARLKTAKAQHKAHTRLSTILAGGRVRTRKVA
jgi:hypothetical protein